LRGFQLILLQPLDFALNIVAGASLVGVHLAVAADASGGVVPVEEAEDRMEAEGYGEYLKLVPEAEAEKKE